MNKMTLYCGIVLCLLISSCGGYQLHGKTMARNDAVDRSRHVHEAGPSVYKNGSSAAPVSPVPNDAVQTYAFTGAVESIRADTLSIAKIGDRITGAFIVDHSAVSIPVNGNRVSYRFASGTPLVFTLNTLEFGAGLSLLPCMAAVADNESVEGKILDYFRISCTDDALRSSLGLGFFAATLNLTDSTAAVFTGTSLPRDVNLQSFDKAWLALVATKRCDRDEQCTEPVFDVMIRIETIAKKQ